MSSHLFGFIDNIMNMLGFSELGFVIIAKVADKHGSKRYEKEVAVHQTVYILLN